MKAFLFSLFLLASCNMGYCQNKFNKIYRLDSLQQLSILFKSMRVIDNAIYTAGVGVIVDSMYQTNPGIFTRFNLQGEILHNKYLGRFPTSSEVWRDAMLPISKDKFLIAGHNWDSSFSATLFNKNGEIIFKKQYFSSINETEYRLPPSVSEINTNRFAIVSVSNKGFTSKPAIIIIDSFGTQVNNFTIESDWILTIPLQVSLNKTKKLTLMTYGFTGDPQRVEHRYATQLYEFDTLGNMQWRYQTPTNRYVIGDGFVQLANGNYLMWGREEFTYPDAFNRYRLYDSVRVFVQEIKPSVGVVWNKYFDAAYAYDLKILKDSSIVFIGRHLDPSNLRYLQGYLFKLNKNRDSLFKRSLTHPTFGHGIADYYPEKIDELDNGDLVIAGYAQDNKQGSPTQGQWGWLIRTDSMGCSLESTCRVPTTEVEKGPLSIKAYPNPTRVLKKSGHFLKIRI
jgi:hypothetical protein